MNRMKIDWPVAAKLLGIAVAALLALSFLPELLRAPEPPPLDPRVGLLPAPEQVGAAAAVEAKRVPQARTKPTPDPKPQPRSEPEPEPEPEPTRPGPTRTPDPPLAPAPPPPPPPPPAPAPIPQPPPPPVAPATAAEQEFGP